MACLKLENPVSIVTYEPCQKKKRNNNKSSQIKLQRCLIQQWNFNILQLLNSNLNS